MRGDKGLPHFGFECEGKKIVYCYIRKNACTAFKKLIVDLSESPNKPKEGENPIQFMAKNCRSKMSDMQRADHVIFVHRDPIERIVALFINKFVMQDGNEDIFESYYRVTGFPPQSASFSQFVNRYLTKGVEDLDPHVRPQRTHLLPVCYTDAIPLPELYGAMKSILNEKVADEYFSNKVNSSSSHDIYDEFSISSVSADRIREVFLSEGKLPSKRSFIQKEIELSSMLDKIYIKDKPFKQRRG